MRKFCPNCGTPIADETITTCTNCGANLSGDSAAPAVQAAVQTNSPVTGPTPGQANGPVASPQLEKKTTMTRQELFNRAVPFFAARQYSVNAQSDYLISFQSQNKDVNWIIIVILCCFAWSGIGLIALLIYYFMLCHNHQVTISISDASASEVTFTTIGNTDEARKDAGEFIAGIP
jgi:hypothetical protein